MVTTKTKTQLAIAAVAPGGVILTDEIARGLWGAYPISAWLAVSGLAFLGMKHPRVNYARAWDALRKDQGIIRRPPLARAKGFVLPSRKSADIAAQIRKEWDLLCRRAKWTRTEDGEDITPPLLDAKADGPDTVVVRFRPWITDTETTHEGRAHIIRRAIDGQTASVRVDPFNPGVIEARIGLTPLPTMVELKEPPAAVAVDGSARFVIGAKAGGGVAEWCPLESPHLLIAGATDFGKGGLLRMLICQARDWQVRVISPKPGEFSWTRVLPDCRVSRTPQGHIDLLREVEAHRQRVQQAIEAHGDIDKWTELPPHLRPTPMLLVVDEASEAMDGDGKSEEVVADLLSTLGRMARSAGIHLAVATQRPDVAGGALGKRGGQFRAQLTGRVVVGSIDPHGADMMLGPAGRERAATLATKGRALVTGLDAHAGGTVATVQIQWLPQAVAATVAARPATAATPDMAGAGSDTDVLSPPTGGESDRTCPDKGRSCPDADASAGANAGVAATAEEESVGCDAAAGDDPVGGPGAAPGGLPGGAGGATRDPPVGAGDGGRVVRLRDAQAILGLGERQVRRVAENPADDRAEYVSRGYVRVRVGAE